MYDRFLALSYEHLTGEHALLAGYVCGLVERLSQQNEALRLRRREPPVRLAPPEIFGGSEADGG